MPTAIIGRGSASPRTVPFAIVKSASVRKSARREITRRNFSLAAEKAALINSLRSAEKNWFATCSDFRDAGLHWKNIRADCKEQKISAAKWATENAPISLRWLDKYRQFADRWEEFVESWRWSEALPYAPERRPGLWGAFDLMDAKARFDTYSEARKRNYRGDGGNGTVVPFTPTKRHITANGNPIRLTATATLLHGDVADMMREHIADASIDLAVADVPYFIRGPIEVTEPYIHRNGMKAPFNEDWDLTHPLIFLGHERIGRP